MPLKFFEQFPEALIRKKKLFCISLLISRRKPHAKSGLHPKPPKPSPIGVHFVFSKAYVGHHRSHRSCIGVSCLTVLSKESYSRAKILHPPPALLLKTNEWRLLLVIQCELKSFSQNFLVDSESRPERKFGNVVCRQRSLIMGQKRYTLF